MSSSYKLKMSDCDCYYDSYNMKALKGFKRKIIKQQEEAVRKRNEELYANLKNIRSEIGASQVSQVEKADEKLEGDNKPLEVMILNTANVLKHVLKVSTNIKEMDLGDYIEKIQSIRVPETEDPVEKPQDNNVKRIPKMEPIQKDIKGNFGKDFARGDHPSRSGANYCVVVEEDDMKPKPKRWNGPGMKMLPPLYGESLHNHSKVVDVGESWEPQPENYEVRQESEIKSTSSNRSTMERSVPLYVTKENEQQLTCEEQRLTEVVQKYKIGERSISFNNKTILWLRFTRSNTSTVLVFLVMLNGSYYIWYEWLLKKFADVRKVKLSMLRNPANCDDVLGKLNSMVSEKFEDLTLTTVRNYDLLREVDVELADVLEVFHYNWKNPQFKIQLMKLSQ